MILGILRGDGSYCGVPRGKYPVHPGETLILCGKLEVIAAIKDRIVGMYGDIDHEEAREIHEEEIMEQDLREGEYKMPISVAKGIVRQISFPLPPW